MANYSIAVLEAADSKAALRLLRPITRESVATLLRRMGTSEPVLMFDTSDCPLDIEARAGMAARQAQLLALLRGLRDAGATVLLRHHAGEIAEEISGEMLRNLFESQLRYLDQEHD